MNYEPEYKKIMAPDNRCEWELNNGALELFQWLPALSRDFLTVRDSRLDPVDQYDSLWFLSDFPIVNETNKTITYPGGPLGALAEIVFKNCAGDTETNAGPYAKRVKVPFHDNCFDFFEPYSLNAPPLVVQCDYNNGVITGVKDQIEFEYKISGVTNESLRNRRREFRTPDDSNFIKTPPPASSFEPRFVDYGQTQTRMTPLFGVLNAYAQYDNWVTPAQPGNQFQGGYGARILRGYANSNFTGLSAGCFRASDKVGVYNIGGYGAQYFDIYEDRAVFHYGRYLRGEFSPFYVILGGYNYYNVFTYEKPPVE